MNVGGRGGCGEEGFVGKASVGGSFSPVSTWL